jgi:hypothetical protein
VNSGTICVKSAEKQSQWTMSNVDKTNFDNTLLFVP